MKRILMSFVQSYTNDEILKLLFIHNIECFTYDQIIESSKPLFLDLLVPLKSRAVVMAFSMQKKYRDSLAIIEHLNTLEVKFKCIKGIALSNNYKKYYHRSMSDIDILISLSDINAVVEHLSLIGYKPIDQEVTNKDIKLIKPGCLDLELHFRLFPPNSINEDSRVCDDFWRNDYIQMVDGISVPTLTPIDHFRYLVLHKVVHLKHSGFGIKQLIDLSMLVNAYHIDCSAEVKYFEKLGYDKFYNTIVAICEQYLDMDQFYNESSMPTVEEHLISELLNLIISNGAFGNHSEELKLRSLKGYLQKQYHKRRMFPPIVYGFFPRRDDLTLRYQYARHNVLLLPIAWIHRFVYYLFRKDISLNFKLFLIKEKEGYEQKELLLKKLSLD